ncbi:MAG: tetratricopeptide repeat protein [Thermodesulfobacteriota bacterium]
MAKDYPARGPEAAGRLRAGLFAAAAALLAFAVYLPTLAGGFVNWDDPTYIYKNEMIRSMDGEFFRWAFTSVVSGNWHPLTMISHAVDYALWGLAPWGHHLTSILLHAVNTALVFFLTLRVVNMARRTEGARGRAARGLAAAFITSVLFAVHPLHVESVAWLSERKDLLSALFYILALLAYLGYATGRGRVSYCLSLVFLTLSLMSKPMAVSLPLVLLILDWYPLGRLRFDGGRGRTLRVAAEKLPFFALAGVFSLLTLWAQGQAAAVSSLESAPLASRLLVASRGYIFYLVKMFVPAGLAPYYPYPGEIRFLSMELLGPVVIFAALTALAAASIRKRRWFAAAWLTYLVTLAPVAGIVKIGAMAAADRYFYIPGVAPLVLIGAGAGALAHARKKGIMAAVVVAAAVLSVLTVRQIGVWKDSITLWTHEISIYPDSVPLAYANRGIAYGGEGRIALALADFSRAAEIKPDFAKAYYNRANAYDILGRKEEAIEDLSAAIRVKPRYLKAYYRRGVLYAGLGRYPEAARDLEAAVELAPGFRPALLALGRVYAAMGDRAASELYYERARGLASPGPGD